ncbi:APC family permease [Labilibaculum sp. K2S]|uniref:APC family permease n=1 Tax=Labilibaculum sp. K2S TaxID=3056386 RepID=UPI0025A485B2|nr:APC family permease [Labilibaculum sp. K2S]MDM8159591.1 APC family permease [Labilibaculum sp. K2S]
MDKSKNKIGLWSAVGLGVGAMIGAGIFALMGQAGAIAGKAVYISFILGGIVAAISGYSLAKLGARFPAAGGIVEYLVQSFGVNVFTGGISVMLYLASLISLALLAKAFGSYAAALLNLKGSLIYTNIFALSIITLLGTIQYFGIKKVVKFQNVAIIITILILVVFATVGLIYMKPELMAPALYPSSNKILFSIAITFFSYEGFRIITNTAEDIVHPEKNLTKAIFISIGITMVIYTALAFAVFGNLEVDQVLEAKDYALAEAARPAFGVFGFTIISIAALFATSSSINAVLFATNNIAYQMAKNGELPGFFANPIGKTREGLIVSVVLTALLILFLDLLQIAAIGSITVLFIHAITHLGHLKLINKTKASKLLVALALITTLGVIVLFLKYSIKDSYTILILSVGVLALSFLIEFLIRAITKRKVNKTREGISGKIFR